MTPAARPSEKGNILLTVILIVAVMATLAVAIMDDIRFAIRRSSNVEARAQAFQYATGAEQFAMDVIGRALRVSPERLAPDQKWMREPVTFPIENGGIEVRIADGGNCFNLNALASGGEESGTQADPKAIRYYRNLLEALDFSEGRAETLANAAADWIDADDTPLPGGAEDYYYTGLDVPSRAANTMMAEVSELRGVKGYDRETFARVRPYVCTHAGHEMSALNLNTLSQDDAPLLIMVLGRKVLSLGDARALIAARPADGYAGTAEFWAEQVFAGKAIGEAEQALVSLKTGYYDLRVQVVYLEAFVGQVSLLRVRGASALDVVSRHYGVAE